MKTLRPYQSEGLEKIYAALEIYNSVLYQQPTGTGKSVVAESIILKAIQEGLRVLVVVPTEELLENIAGYFVPQGIACGYIISGRATIWKHKITIATVQSLYRRLEGLPKNFKPDLVIHDECQHSPSKTWRAVMDYFTELGAKHVGFSATPGRLDGKPFDDLFDTLIPSKPVRWFIDQGYLSDFRYISVDVKADLGKVTKSKSDYLGLQEELLDTPEIVGDLIETWKTHALGVKTLVFAATIEHSQHICQEYNRFGMLQYGRVIAAHLDSNTPKKLRKEIFRQFKEGEILVLCNVALFTEGVDVPDCGCVQMARYSNSLNLVLQCWGRALRPSPGKTAILLDHVGLYKKHLKPDAYHTWTLEGVVREHDYWLQCPHCQTVVDPDYRKYRVLNPGVLSIFCPECLTTIEVPQKKSRAPRNGEKDFTVSADGELVEITYSNNMIKINSLLATQRSRGYQRGWVLHRLNELVNVTLDEIQYATSSLGFKQDKAFAVWSELVSKGVAKFDN